MLSHERRQRRWRQGTEFRLCCNIHRRCGAIFGAGKRNAFSGPAGHDSGIQADIRIFSPLCALHTLARAYRKALKIIPTHAEAALISSLWRLSMETPIRADTGETRTSGSSMILNSNLLHRVFNAGSAIGNASGIHQNCSGPILQAGRNPMGLIRKAKLEPEFFRLWLADLQYYIACDFFNGRLPMKPARLSRFRRSQTNREHLPPYPYPSSGVSSAIQ